LTETETETEFTLLHAAEVFTTMTLTAVQMTTSVTGHVARCVLRTPGVTTLTAHSGVSVSLVFNWMPRQPRVKAGISRHQHLT